MTKVIERNTTIPARRTEVVPHRRGQPARRRHRRAAGRAGARGRQPGARPVPAGEHPAGAARRAADRGHLRHRRQRHPERLRPGQGHRRRAGHHDQRELATSTRPRSSGWSPTPSATGPRTRGCAQEVDARNELDAVAYQVERRLGELGDAVPAHERARAEMLVADARQAVKEEAPLDRVRVADRRAAAGLPGPGGRPASDAGGPAAPDGGRRSGPGGRRTTTSSTPSSPRAEPMPMTEPASRRRRAEPPAGPARRPGRPASRRRPRGGAGRERRPRDAELEDRLAARARRPGQPAQAVRPGARARAGGRAGPGRRGVAAGARQPRAARSSTPTADPASIVEGVRAVRDQAVARAGRGSATRAEDEVGEPFDPARHEAVGVVDDRGRRRRAPSSQVVRPGYGDGERQLRPGRGRGRRPGPELTADGRATSTRSSGCRGREPPRRSSRRTASWPARYHPDVNKDPAAEERFKEITEAYDVLSDPEHAPPLRRVRRGLPAGPGGRATGARRRRRRRPAARRPARPRGRAAAARRQRRLRRRRASRTSTSRTCFGGMFGGRGRRGAAGRSPAPTRRPSSTLTVEEAYRGGRRTITLAGPGRPAHARGRRSRPGSPTASGSGWPGRAAGAAATAPPGDLYLVVRHRAAPALPGRRAATSTSTCRWPRGRRRSARPSPVDTPAARPRCACPPGTSSGRRLRLRGRACPTRAGTPGDLLRRGQDHGAADSSTDEERRAVRGAGRGRRHSTRGGGR